MIENEKICNNETEIESDAEPITKASRMKHGWCQTINNTVHFYQKPFIIALFLELVSSYNIFFREKISKEKSSHAMQNNMIINKNVFVSKFCATANECAPHELDEKQ